MAKIAEIVNGEQDRTFDLLREPEGLFLQVKLYDSKSKVHYRLVKITISDVLYQVWKAIRPSEKREACKTINALIDADKKLK